LDPFGLRVATLADVPAMCRNVAEGVGSYAAWAPPGWAAHASAADPDRVRERFATPGFVAYVNRDVSAHVATHPAADEPGAVHLMHLFARPAQQGTGVAAALLELVVSDARRAGAAAMRLRTPSGSARGVAFYEREGFAITGPAEDAGIGLPLIWMRRAL
jgi:GNAT superfamily N-acetyltransferase